MRKINPVDWYQFRKRASKVHPFILDLMYHYLTTPLFTKIYGASPVEQIDILEGDWANASIPVSQINSFGHVVVKKIYQSSKFTTSLIVRAKTAAQKMTRDLKKIGENKNLYEIYSTLVEDYRRFCLFSFPLWIFGERTIYNELEKILKKRKLSNENFNKYLTTLIIPQTSSLAFQEELETMQLVLDFKKERIKNLIDKFGFMIYDYRGPKIKEERDYLGEIKKLSQKTNLKEELKEKKNFYKKLKEQQEALIKKLKLTQKEQNIIYALRDAAILQDMRKYYNSYLNFKTEILFKKMAKILKIPFQLARYILPDEMKKIWQTKGVDKKILQERIKLCVFNIKNGKSEIFIENEVKPFLVLKEEYIKEKDIIKGVVASIGKVVGKVRIVKKKEEINKVKEGEILVTPMTMPDFAPAIKKCVAIVTDEGGITCHAAIVSRELGIPCIIGTKYATSVFKDGDLVEVDANKGIVKK